MIGDYLTRRGFAVDAVECGEGAIAAVSTTTYDAVVLDLGLPDIDGIEVLATVRAWTKGRLPALIVTARDSIRSEEHTSELQSLMRISYAVFCLKKKTI